VPPQHSTRGAAGRSAPLVSAFLGRSSRGTREGTTLPYRKGHVLFSQGDAADAVFSIQKGKVKLTVVSKQNKEAVIAILTTGDLVGEASLVGQPPIRTRQGDR
jgi:CRP/FNR family transcriptional regulator, cyclic AMP receptor protein